MTNHHVQVRKVQALGREKSLTIVLAKEFVIKLGIEKGDFIKSYVDEDRLIFQKVKI